MNPHVPTPASARISGGQSCGICAPASPSPTPTPEYRGADPRPQISSSVNISLFFSKRWESFGEKNHYFISSEKCLKFLNITHMLICVYMLLIISLRNLHHCLNPHKVCPLHLADASLVPFSL